MDTSELIKLGARSLVVNICRQLEEVVTAVPELKRFAYSLARESVGIKVGIKPAGRTAGKVNGAARERLSALLTEARGKRGGGTGRPGKPRGPLTEEHKAVLRRAMKKRWRDARKHGAVTLNGRPAGSDAKKLGPAKTAAE